MLSSPASSAAGSKSHDGQIGYVVRTGRIPPGVATGVTEIYADVAEGSGQNLTLKPLSSGSCLISGDGELLTRLLVNLVENAITDCPPGTTITLSLVPEEQHYRACVADNGGGIPEEERELVFRRLYRLDKSRTTPGNVLGLGLVKASPIFMARPSRSKATSRVCAPACTLRERRSPLAPAEADQIAPSTTAIDSRKSL